MTEATHIEVEAGVRYWEDADVDGVTDDDGSRIPCRTGDAWCPTIDLATGAVIGWPAGVHAIIHYKVSDAGRYWLLNAAGERIAKWKGFYVPDRFLCHDGEEGYGDYIILEIDGAGAIRGYERPEIDPDQWVAITPAKALGSAG